MVGHTLLLGAVDTSALGPFVQMVDTVGVGSLVEGGGNDFLPAATDGPGLVLAGGGLGAGGMGVGILSLVPVWTVVDVLGPPLVAVLLLPVGAVLAARSPEVTVDGELRVALAGEKSDLMRIY